MESRVFGTLNSTSGIPEHMDLRVISKTDEELVLEISGEDHTFLNVLKGALLDTDGVAAATYDMNPEQSGGQTDPVLTVKTAGDIDPLDALETATETVQDTAAAFRDAFDEAAEAAA